jgi:hypothetical protein
MMLPKDLTEHGTSLDGWLATRVFQVNEETSGHARTFAGKFCISGRFLDISRQNARTFPLSGWQMFPPLPEQWPKAFGKLGHLGQTSEQPEGLNNPAEI